MTAEENRHNEKMIELNNAMQEIQNAYNLKISRFTISRL